MNNRKLVTMALFITAAMMLSYIESLFPFFFGVPGDEAGAGESGGSHGALSVRMAGGAYGKCPADYAYMGFYSAICFPFCSA